MFVFKAAFVLFSIQFIQSTMAENQQKKLSAAIIDFIKASHDREIYIFRSLTETTNIDFDFFLTRSGIDLENPVQLEDSSNVTILQDRKRFFVINLVGSIEGLMNFIHQITPEKFFYNGKFLIASTRSYSNNELELVFNSFWKIYIYNIAVIVPTSKGFDLLTFMPFKKGNCRDMHPVTINKYEGKSMNWQRNIFFPRKFGSLHNCSIRCGAFPITPAVMIRKNAFGVSELFGQEVNIFEELMIAIKANINYTIYPVETGTVFINGSGTGLLGHTLKGDVDVSISAYSLQMMRAKYLSESVSYFSDRIILIMPPTLPLNPLLKFAFPFTLTVWLSLLVLIIIICIVIRLLKSLPLKWYERLIGDEMRNEYLNIVVAILGLSQTNLPVTNFSRIFLTKLLLFCLIVRCLYLGSLFRLLKSDVLSKEIKTIDGFIDAQYDFYIYETLAKRLVDANSTQFSSRRKVIDTADLDYYSKQTLNPNFNGIVFQYFSVVAHDNLMNRKNFTLKICKEPLMTNQIVFYYQKNFYLVDEINEIIQTFKSNGFINFILSKYANDPNINLQFVEAAAKLTLEHFKGILQILLFGLSTSFIIFLMELIRFKYSARPIKY